MGNPAAERAAEGPSSHTRATFSGATAFIGVLTLLITIISAAVPHWGSYSPTNQFFQRGATGAYSQDSTGHFGPFQVCMYHAYYSYCGNVTSPYKPSTWLIVAGICAIACIIALAFFCLFSILHVAMQLQRREIWVSFQKDVFFKLVFASLAVLANFGATIFGGIEFSLSGRHNALQYRIGVCYYLQIFLIFVNILLVILSYMSYTRARRYPIHLVPKGRASNYAYDNRYGMESNNGVSMTSSSGQPYNNHGTPRFPIRSDTVQNAHQYAANAMNSYANGHTLPTVHFTTTATQPGPQAPPSNGFQSVGLQAPQENGHMSSSPQPQPLPVQPIRPIQPGIPQHHGTSPPTAVVPPTLNISNLPQVLPSGSNGVSFTPQGRSGYTKMGPHAGSMESLDSTQSTISTYSFGSSTSTGSAHGPLRSSLKKPKNKDIASVSSKSSSKQVRISLGAEQTQV